MCTRLTFSMPDPRQLAELLSVVLTEEARDAYRPRYNVAPSQEHLVLRDGDRAFSLAHWGVGPHKQVNARAETILSRKHTAVKGQQRCIVPATGFYEWTGPKNARQPVYFHRPDDGPILFAGLSSTDREGNHFLIITTEANALVAPVHDRMPVILDVRDVPRWLKADNPEEARQLLRPAPREWLVAHKVSPRVNKPANDDAQLIEPIREEPRREQLRLF